jgi:hypothetical protein
MPLQLQVQQAPSYAPPPPPAAPANPGADALYSALQHLVSGGGGSALQEGYPEGVPPFKRRALQ